MLKSMLDKELIKKNMLDIRSWISGFTDGEGCFSISFTKRKKMKLNVEVRCSISISQERKSLKSLQVIENYFKCGGIRYSNRDQTYKYEVRDLRQLKVLVNHFEKYKLLTNKQEDFNKFKLIYKKVQRKEHLNRKGIEEIIEIAYTMNESGKRKYTKEELLKLIVS